MCLQNKWVVKRTAIESVTLVNGSYLPKLSLYRRSWILSGNHWPANQPVHLDPLVAEGETTTGVSAGGPGTSCWRSVAMHLLRLVVPPCSLEETVQTTPCHQVRGCWLLVFPMLYRTPSESWQSKVDALMPKLRQIFLICKRKKTHKKELLLHAPVSYYTWPRNRPPTEWPAAGSLDPALHSTFCQ